MPFVQFDVNETIERRKKESPEFAAAWERNQENNDFSRGDRKRGNDDSLDDTTPKSL